MERIVPFIRAGNYVETAAAYVGVSKTALYAWMKEGARDEAKGKQNLRTEFLNAIERAAAEAEIRDVQRVDAASEAGNWQASAWRLERRTPGKWGRKEKVDLAQKGELTVRYVATVRQDGTVETKRDEPDLRGT